MTQGIDAPFLKGGFIKLKTTGRKQGNSFHSKRKDQRGQDLTAQSSQGLLGLSVGGRVR